MALDYSKQQTLINIELKHGKELAIQLETYLVDPDTEKSGNVCELLLQKILSSYEKSLVMLKSSAVKWQEANETPQCISSDSPRSDISDQSHQKVQKKRKALPQWSKISPVSTRAGLDDGYSWRKYGQKDILGATFPRAYYRCTHRHTQGCLATKQVQKLDGDRSIFHITCKGRHTCNQANQSTNMPGTESKKKKKEEECTEEARTENETKEMLFNCETTSLKTEKLEAMLETFPSFSFPSTSTETTGFENKLFSNALWENDSPTYLSQDASESEYFSLSCHMNELEISQYLQHSESDNMEMLSAPNSVNNSPTEDLDISLDHVKFDPDFPFDLAEYFH